MGAFVGEVTSPFLRRRKGRVGKDKWVDKTAPALAGAIVKFLAGNYECIVTSANASGTFHRNTTKGDSAWTAVVLGSGVIGNAAGAGRAGVVRPYYDDPDFELNKGVPQFCFYFAGVAGPNGSEGRIFAGGYSGGAVGAGDAAHPHEDIAFTPDGRNFLGVGDGDGANAFCRGGGADPEAGESVLIPDTAPSGLSAVGAIVDPAIPYPTFISGAQTGGNPLHKSYRQAVGNWIHKNITNPVAGGIPRRFCIIRDGACILICTNGLSFMRSTNYGESFVEISTPATAMIRDVFRHGRRFFAVTNAAPKLIMSKNFGLTWAAHNLTLPHAGALLDASCEDFTNRYVISHEGAANHFYIFKGYFDI